MKWCVRWVMGGSVFQPAQSRLRIRCFRCSAGLCKHSIGASAIHTAAAPHLRAPVEAAPVAAGEDDPDLLVRHVHGRSALAVRRVAAVADDIVRGRRRELGACTNR